MIISQKITILGKKHAENGVGVLIYGEKNWRLKKYGGVNFMDIFCNIWEKMGGCVFKVFAEIAHLFRNIFPTSPGLA